MPYQPTILEGETAAATLKQIMDKYDEQLEQGGYRYPEPHVAGFFKEGESFTAFDNNTGDCFVESFATEEEARKWAANID